MTNTGTLKFSIGYRLPSDFGSMVDICREYRREIKECYFAMPGDPSGRAPVGVRRGEWDAEVFPIFWSEIRQIVDLGIEPVLLLNAACYGKEAISQPFQAYFLETVRELCETIGLTVLTTTSPFVAKEIKDRYSSIEVRASVNMRLQSIHSLEYLSDSFDGFYLAKELNRDIPALREIRTWADSQGKRIHLLANSGCFFRCPWQTFHDSMVAHETEIREQQNVPLTAPSPCWDYLKNSEHHRLILRNTWIRPEDIDHYASLCDTMKLATRSHDNPGLVVDAYVKRFYAGNLLCLFEPSFLPVFANTILDNRRFPADWFDKTAFCNKKCDSCSYCNDVYSTVRR
jgi:collagenase-like PrtC family protease